MCGIVAFLSAAGLSAAAEPEPYAELTRELSAAGAAADWDRSAAALAALAGRFDDMMSFAIFRRIATDAQVRGHFERLAGTLRDTLEAVSARSDGEGLDERLRHLNELLRDYLWQVEVEVLGLVERACRLLPEPADAAHPGRLFLAWAAERVLDSLDKLEVRGRDSAGIAIGLSLGDWSPTAAERAEIARRGACGEAATGEALLATAADGRPVLRVLHKVANLVGRLGDNGVSLRAAIRGDALLWSAADALAGISIVAHTRWASNGIISVGNCHPVDGRVVGGDAGREILSVINGDVDNYDQLMATAVRGNGLECHPAVTTDAKILPVKLALETPADAPLGERLATVLRACRGSLATAVQVLDTPGLLGIGQQGSGQALYLGQVADGWLVASEVYGLAACCRSFRALSTGGELGVAVVLDVTGGAPAFAGRRLTGEAWEPPVEPVGIFARDIFRGDYAFFIEKEIAQAPDSVQSTLHGKYAVGPEGVRFLLSGFGNGAALAERLRAEERMPIRRIAVIGHGTASIAGMGVVHLLRQALVRSGLSVEWSKASELFGFAGDRRMDDTLVVAISQSGTTTDTNRIVDIARKRGAWVHAIVNRRNSALVQKADSYLYTSDGRDVEMSVASTKAYYSQVAAGKVLALFLASELGAMSDAELKSEIAELETLPAKIRAVLALQPRLAELARTYGLKARNWAIVGNGANRVAAEEIRIKLSELCYKAIPCDVTEDKKHIDLSTEPLTLVVANDLPEEVVQDTAKEVAIFKAHNGRPLVFCAAGETRFDAVAQAAVPLPNMGAGLAFVLATVAGHLFGIEAAKAIDETAQPVRQARHALGAALDGLAGGSAGGSDLGQVRAALAAVWDGIESGGTDTALPAGLAVRFARAAAAVERAEAPERPHLEAMLAILNAMVEELSRPIDTIRHQAKTVTVGVSRPQQELSPLVEEVLWRLALTSAQMKRADLEVLEAISPLVDTVEGAMRYRAVAPSGDQEWTLQAEAALGTLKVAGSRFAEPRPALGTKRTVLRTGSLHFSTGASGTQSIVALPIWRDGALRPTDVLLLDLGFLPQAPVPQLASVLRALHSKYDELLETVQERLPGRQVADLLAGLSPREAILYDTGWIVARLGGQAGGG